MSSKLYCSNCGAELPEGAVFCFKCGVRVLAQPNQPMITRESMTAAGNIEPNLNMEDKYSTDDSIDMSLTTILRDLEGITASDNPSSYPNAKRYKETPFSYTDPEKPLSSLIPDLEEDDSGLGIELEEPATKQPIRQTLSIERLRTSETTKKTESTKVETVQNQVQTDTDPWPWEIPAFTNTDESAFPALDNRSTPASLPQDDEFDIPQNTVPSRVKKAQTQQELDDPYLNRTGTFSPESTGTVPPEKPTRVRKNYDDFDDEEDEEEEFVPKKTKKKQQQKHYKYDDEDDFDDEDEYNDPKRWPIILLAVVILIVVLFTALYFLKPSILNRGIDAINSVSGSTLHHIGESDDEPASVITAEPEESDEAEEEDEPEEEEEEQEDEYIAEIVSTEDYMDDVSSHFCHFYVEYLDAMNNGEVASLGNVDDDLRDELEERYEKYNKDYTFENEELYMDTSTYLVYSTEDDDEYDVDFRIQAFNYTVQNSDGSEVENNPIMNIRIHYIPDSDDWTVIGMEIDNTADMSAADTIQIVE